MRGTAAGAFAAVLAGTLALLATPARADDPPTPTGVQVVAHRGSVDRAPEHTLAALDQAVADRADRVGIDVHLTRDGVPVVVHDVSLARTTDVEQRFPGTAPYAVGQYSLAQVKTLDAGSWYADGTYTGSRVLTLDEVLTELAGSPLGLVVEIKRPGLYGGLPGIGRAVTSVLDAHPEWSTPRADGSPRLLVESFDWGFLQEMASTFPALPLVLLGETVTPVDLDAHPFVREIDVRHDHLTPELVEHAHATGRVVGTWTPNTGAAMQRAVDLGSDAIATDEPDLLRRLLASLGRAWTGAAWTTSPPTARAEVIAPPTALVGGRVRVVGRAATETGVLIPWQPVAFQARVAGVWRTVGTNATDAAGAAVLSLPVTEGMRVRTVSGGRTSTERVVTAVTHPVVLPAGAPRPASLLRPQPRPSSVGADPRISTLSGAVWRAMVGRSWRSGCPVGRSALRTLRVSYWGFDGHRHRGELVVARGSAHQLARAFTQLYARRLPVSSLRRLETLGSYRTAVGRALRADAGFAYACQRVPGDTTRHGSHARGTVLTLNPWENPARVSGRGLPNSWWLSRSRPLRYVHRAAQPVVQVFASQGFAWNGRYGRYADFRDVR